VRINLNTKEIDVKWLGQLDPTHVLFEADGPRLFTSQDTNEQPLLVYLCAEDTDGADYFVVPTSPETINALEQGHLSLHDALGQSWGWLVSTTADGRPARAQVASLSVLPKTASPAPNIPLSADHLPLLGVKLTGPNLRPGHISASVVRTAADKSIRALKKLAHTALEAHTAIGRPEERLRRIYDLPVQNVRFASFEITFGKPLSRGAAASGEPSDEQVVGEVSSLLTSGLRWLNDEKSHSPPTIPEPVSVLEALAQLVPPAYGPIESVELSGTLVRQSRPYVLTRKNSLRVREALTRIAPTRVAVKIRGMVREFDKDESSFILRNVSDGLERHCSVEGEAADMALSAFQSDVPVEVVGYEVPGTSDIDVLTVAVVSSSEEASVPKLR
jgi:hypothetical protein